MRIYLAKSAGFCFGVKRALKIAFKAASSGQKVYMLGDIVHNETVVKQIQDLGIKKINKLSSQGKNKMLLIRAHGASLDTIKKARNLGYRIIDATCPMVKEIHSVAGAMERKGCKIIIIGDKMHDEVQGITGQLKNKTLIIENIDSMPIRAIKKIKKACVIAQSTQNLDLVLKIVDILKSYIKNLRFFNTICMPTRLKQEEIKQMPCNNDVIIIIGSRTSANTRRLFEISRSINKRTYWVNSRPDIKKSWLKNAEKVGVTAGASTPDSITKEIVKYLKTLS